MKKNLFDGFPIFCVVRPVDESMSLLRPIVATSRCRPETKLDIYLIFQEVITGGKGGGKDWFIIR